MNLGAQVGKRNRDLETRDSSAQGTPEDPVEATYEVAIECNHTRINLNEEDVVSLDSSPWNDSFVEPQVPLWRDGVCTGLLNNIFPSCICAFCLPCLIGSQLSDRLGLHGFFPTLSFSFSALGLVAIIFIFVRLNTIILYYLLLCYLAWAVRDRIRATLKIPGHGITDCLLSFILMPCVVAQNARQLYDYRGICLCSDPGIYSMNGMPSMGHHVLPAPLCTTRQLETPVVSAQPLQVVTHAPA